MGNDFNDFPNGRYTGVFVFDSFPQLNFSKELVGTKSVLNNGVNFNFTDISILDSIQFRIRATDGRAYITMKNLSAEYYGYVTYLISISNNVILGKEPSYESYSSNYPSSFTLTYTP